MDSNQLTSKGNYIKEKIRKNYIRIIDNWVETKEYSRNRDRRFFLIVLYSTICALIPFSLYKFGAFDITTNNNDVLFGIAIIAITVFPFAVWTIIAWQNIKFATFIKKQCTKNIMQNLLQIEYKDQREYERYIKQYADMALNFDDVKELDLADTFYPKAVIDFFVGSYNNITYSFQELAIYIGAGKGRCLEYAGSVIKTNANLNVKGWVDVQDKKAPISRTLKFIAYYACGLLLCLAIAVQFCSLIMTYNEEYLYVAIPICLVAGVIISYTKVNQLMLEEDKKMAAEKQLCRLTGNLYIDEKLCIKTSDESIDISEIVTSDFVDLFKELKNLFKMETLHFRINNNKIFLTIDKRTIVGTDMFELGGLFSSPKSEKVREKFISQLSGILVFLDYIHQLQENLKCKANNENTDIKF